MPEPSPMYEVTAYIAKDDEGNYAARPFEKGELLYKYLGPDYGVIDREAGVAVSEAGCYKHPFWQIPRDKVRELE